MSRIKKDLIHFLEKHIIDFFRVSGRKHLPWRNKHISPYQVWISEIMLQQTQVSRVINYYERFLKKFPNVFELAKASWEEFLPYYSGLGYYQRGRNMLRTAKTIVEDFDGEFPRDKKQLMSLPGIGEYTANAILAFGYKKNVLAVDTNLKKVLGRYFLGNKKITSFKIQDSRFKIEDCDLAELSAAMMDFANLVCLKKPKCDECPLKKNCKYFATGGRLEESPRGLKTNFPTKDAQVRLWLHKDHKEYYSPHPDRFEAFQLPRGISTRDQIKQYFREQYRLELAVRPPHKKLYVNKQPVMFVNAQILLGEHEFAVFDQKELVS